jgi:hypothetical protein
LHPFWFEFFASFLMALYKVIALPSIAIAIAVTLLALKGDSEKITITFR